MNDTEKKSLNDLLYRLTIVQSTCEDGWWKELHSGHGLCYLVYVEGGRAYNPLIKKIFKTWEHYSGCTAYPVPFPENRGNTLTRLYYRVYKCWVVKIKKCHVDDLSSWSFTNMKLWDGEYGKLRKSLLRHMIIEIKKELDIVKESL